MITESACKFGPNLNLAGIVTLPRRANPKTAVVLVSAGLSPKFGPFRLYTLLARRLAEKGFLVLRFDLGEIGESRQSFINEPLRKRTELQIRTAIDYLSAKYKISGFTLGGLCSGAEDSFRYAETDPRVTGVMMIDPFAYRTQGWYRRKAMMNFSKKVAAALGLYQPLHLTTKTDSPLVDYRYMDHTESSRILQTLLQRKVHLHFLYTGGMHPVFNYKGQVAHMFPGLKLNNRVSVDHLPRIGHTQPLEEDRELVIHAIVRRIFNAVQGTTI